MPLPANVEKSEYDFDIVDQASLAEARGCQHD
jgi:hypothetical protein